MRRIRSRLIVSNRSSYQLKLISVFKKFIIPLNFVGATFPCRNVRRGQIGVIYVSVLERHQKSRARKGNIRRSLVGMVVYLVQKKQLRWSRIGAVLAGRQLWCNLRYVIYVTTQLKNTAISSNNACDFVGQNSFHDFVWNRRHPVSATYNNFRMAAFL